MKYIEIDDELYAYIASQTKQIGESASDILRRLLLGESESKGPAVAAEAHAESAPTALSNVVEEVSEPTTLSPAEVEIVADSGDLFDRVTATAIAEHGKIVDRFLFVLGALHRIHGPDFAKVEGIKGKNRLYFATSKAQLLESGSSTNPKNIPDSSFWVVTNNNTGKKLAMLKQTMVTLGYSDSDVEALIALFNG